MMVSPYEVDRLFFNTSTTMLVRHSKSPEDREIGRRFAPFWEVLAPKLQDIFPDRGAEGNFIVPSLDDVHKSSAFMIAEMGLGNQCSSLHHQDMTSCLKSLCEPSISDVVLGQIICQASLRLRVARPMCDDRTFASSPFRRLASRGFFFFSGGVVKLLPICVDTCSFTIKCLVVKKLLKPNVVVHTTYCLAVNPY